MADPHPHTHASALGGDRRVILAVAVNIALTLAQIAGGVVAGSLALIADAVHNLSDAIALGIAYIARRIARRPADHLMTFGYGRAEIVSALVNYTSLSLIGMYLIYEGILRLVDPQPVLGWIVVIVAGVALVVDVATVALTYPMAKNSVNMRAAFLHNLADALGSLGVIVAGTLIILFEWMIVDAIITLVIAGYILWHVATETGPVIRILMLGTPPRLMPDLIVDELQGIHGVMNVHHLHVWQFDERRNALEAHLVISEDALPSEVKQAARSLLAQRFAVEHSTLEIEAPGDDCRDTLTIGHA